jgi:hypothetical protein
VFDLELIVYIVATTIFAILLGNNIMIRVKNKNLFARSVQAELDRMSVYAKVEEMLKEKDSKSIEQTDGFLKFVSESRDWAFNYIEETQSAIKAFDEKIGPIVKYYKDSKEPLSHNELELLSEITNAYDTLMSAMPAEENKN